MRYRRRLVRWSMAYPPGYSAGSRGTCGVTLFNIDDLRDFSQDRLARVTAILETQKENFYRWLHYKECMSSVDSLKQALMERLFTQQELAGDLSAAEVVEIAVDKTVDLLVSGLADRITSETLVVRSFHKGNKGGSIWICKLSLSPLSRLTGKKVVIIGGGPIALRRANVLLSFGAEVILIAPECQEVPPGITWLRRAYRPGDLQGAFLEWPLQTSGM